MENKELPPLDFELIIAHITGKSREYILAHPELNITPSQRAKIAHFSRLRLKGEPMAYLLKNKEFWGLEFYVDKRVLIPRPETEHLVEEALKQALKIKQPATFIDVGTGSGCIIVSMARSLGKSKHTYIGVDISKAALTVAQKNAAQHKLEKSITFYQSDLLGFMFRSKNIKTFISDALIITANLPYVSQKLYASAPKSVTAYEPKLALLSGKDGLDHYRKLFSQIKELLQIHPGIKIALLTEISPEQKNALSKMIARILPEFSFIFKKDLASKWRVATIRNF